MEQKILYVASTYSHVVNFHLPYLQAFSQLGYAVDVACGGSAMPIPAARQVIHVPFEKSMSSPKNLAALGQLRRVIREHDYALISCHTSLASFFARMAVRGLKNRPLVACTAHGYLFDDDTQAGKRLLLAGAERLAAPVTDLLMTMNGWDYAYALSHRLGKEIFNIPGMGVAFQRLHPSTPDTGSAVRRELGLAKEQFLLVYGAEFSPRKSQATLLNALVELPAHVGLLLPGDGTTRQQCIALANRLGLAGRVVFPGQVKDMAPWYAAANGAVSASRSEGLPFHIMEAMYCGLPIAATDVKGHSDLITHNANGLLFPYGDSAACALQLRKLADNPALCHRLGGQAQSDAMAYSLEQVLPQVMAHYKALLTLNQAAKQAIRI